MISWVSSKDFFDVGQSGVHPGNTLAKIWLHNSRYETRKEENNTESFYILGLPSESYHKTLKI